MADIVAIQGDNVYLGGNIMGFTQFPPDDFDHATNCQNIIRFDGTYGWIMGTGLNKTNVAMAVLGSTPVTCAPVDISLRVTRPAPGPISTTREPAPS